MRAPASTSVISMIVLLRPIDTLATCCQFNTNKARVSPRFWENFEASVTERSQAVDCGGIVVVEGVVWRVFIVEGFVVEGEVQPLILERGDGCGGRGLVVGGGVGSHY